MKNNKFLTLFLTVLVTGALTGCDLWMDKGNGKVVSEERTAADFNSVELEGIGDIRIYPAQKYNEEDYKVIVTTDSNLQDIIRTSVKGSTLIIDERKNSNLHPTKLKIDVYLPELKKVYLEGVGDIKIAGGSAEELELSLSGVGDIDAKNYKVQTAEVYLSGVGDIKVWTTDRLKGKLSGVGDVLYKGNPSKDIDRDGVGKVKEL